MCSSKRKTGLSHPEERAWSPQTARWEASLLTYTEQERQARPSLNRILGSVLIPSSPKTGCKWSSGARASVPCRSPTYSPPYTSEVEARSRRAPTRFASPTGNRNVIREIVDFRETRKTDMHMHIFVASLGIFGVLMVSDHLYVFDYPLLLHLLRK